MFRLSVTAAVDRIRAWISTTDRRPVTFARHVGLSPNALRDVFDPDWNPRLKTLLACERDIPPDFVPANANGQDRGGEGGVAETAEKVRQGGAR